MTLESSGLMRWTGVLLLVFCLPSCSSAFSACPLCLSLGIVMSPVYEHCHWNTHWNDISHKAKPMLIARWKGPLLTLLQCLNAPRYLPIVICSRWRQNARALVHLSMHRDRRAQSHIPTTTTDSTAEALKKKQWREDFEHVTIAMFHMSLWNFSNIWKKILLIHAGLFTIATPFL